MAATGKMNDLIRNRRAKVVDMNKCNILLYRKTFGIVTGDLGSCHVVVLQSPIAVLLTHVSPRPSLDQAHETYGDEHVARKMDEALTLYAKWRSWFPQGSSAWGVYAWYKNAVALSDQKEIIEQKLAPTGLPIHDRYYTVPVGNERSGRGTVVCGWMEDDRICRLYVEDALQNEIVVHDKHLQLAMSLANPEVTTSQTSKASSSAVDTTRPSGMQASGAQVSSPQTSGAAAGIAAMTILKHFGMDSTSARNYLQRCLQEVQTSPAVSGDSDKAALAAACRAVMGKSPQKLKIEDAKNLLRREISVLSSSRSSTAGPSVSSREVRRKEEGEDESSDNDD